MLPVSRRLRRSGKNLPVTILAKPSGRRSRRRPFSS
jgi:hypothetical protein